MNTRNSSHKTVAVAGHFCPLHSGHLKLFEEARALGDRLVVIVANDEQVLKKSHKIFMPVEERVQILEGLKIVDEVVISCDETPDVCETLRVVKPDIFASGCGPEHSDAIEEKKVCDELGIEAVYRVGGEKVNSSSDILSPWSHQIIKKVKVEGLKFFTPDYFPLQIGMHEPKTDRVVKMHRHNNIMEYMYVEKGKVEIDLMKKDGNHETYTLNEGDSVIIDRSWHGLRMPAGCRVLEVKQGPYSDDKIFL